MEGLWEAVAALGDMFAANRWGLTVFLVVLAALVAQYVAKLLFDRLAVTLERTRNLYDDALLAAARKPIRWGIWSMGVLFAAEIAGEDSGSELFELVDPIRDVTVILLLAWFAVRFIKFVEGHISEEGYRSVPFDPAAAGVVGKLLRASVAITAALLALDALGISIAGVLAFGGLGGIAVGFAARDLLANFFGTLMIFMDRPFAVGDWIRSPDREIEGTVEEIGWRLTLIRTFDQRPLYVPNSAFTTLSVENPSRMRNRRIYEIIGIRYDDVAVARDVVNDIRAMLESHEEIDTGRTLIVNLLNFAPSALDIMVYTFTKTTVWVDFHHIKEDVMLRIAAIVEARGAEFAFPTSTVHLASAPNPEPDDS